MNSDVWLETGEGPKSIAPSLPAGPAGRELPWNINSWLFPKQRCPGAQAMRISLKDTWTTEDKGILHLPIESYQFNHISVPISSRNCDTKALS